MMSKLSRAVFASLLPCVGIGVGATVPSQPNLLVIYADDLGYGDVSIHGAEDVFTPNIDRMAKEGMLFSAMRANCTVCSPSRAALLTGRYADRVGVPGVIRTDPADSWGFLAPGVPTLADELGKVGYHTAIIGKWHLGLEAPNTPNKRGFQHFHGFLGDMMDSYTTHRRHGENYMRLNEKKIDPQGHATELFTEWACDYLEDQSEASKPFFLYLAYNAPHFPIEPPEAWLEKVRDREPELDEKRAMNVAFVEHLDDCIGKVLTAIKSAGLEEDTIVVFTSDNGGALHYAQNNDPWRGGKQEHYDGGLRVPFAVRWPGKIPAGGESNYQGLVFDLFPTFLELAGAEAPARIDAVSLVPILRGGELPNSRELYFVRREGGRRYGGKSYEAIIHDGWKLMQNDPFSPLELYHLEKDPEEKVDLAGSNQAKLGDLTDRLRKHIQMGGVVPWGQPRSEGKESSH
ncbi:sulfatase family protein [Haloferula sp.]|uniref:sulfatase family protein n=1 Tax=Haloferula sp. TaxID=2497595 RepID=UPI003C78F169